MALEKDLELLDDYVAKRLTEQDRMKFEGKLESDPQLRKEFSFQQSIVDGIKDARVAELKTMLNNIPVQPYVSQGALTTKIITSLIAAGIIASGAYYLLTKENQSEVIQDEPVEQTGIEGKSNISSIEDSATNAEIPTISDNSEYKENTFTPPIKTEKTASSTKSLDEKLKRERELVKVVSSTFVTSSTEVVTDNSLSNYHFHYAFKNNKLMLYGSFEQSQYQILEFITAEEHVFFLNYKGNYYLLDDKNNTPTQLIPIMDTQLLKQLKEFRAR